MNSEQPTFTVLVTGANSANRCATGPRERKGIRWTMTMTATTTLEDLDFADDIALRSHRHQDMQEKTNAFSESAGNLGLKVSTQKKRTV
ncbi:hypothetical protein C0Q70_13590 [Pomacea canaliculata]|uniref:Reverse transcriptase domain-containing protein n=1 Tax=Pomacea canaliculata TaxID=400727 RepID=A0A2T7NXN0_POMCA|nr:hypothetical protein C0Q70_13590 [Pomacea canaliculata]